MKDNTFANSVAKTGLILGAVYITGLLPKMIDAFVWLGNEVHKGEVLVRILICIVELVLCILLLRYFMLKYSAKNPEADNSKVFCFGMLAALLSSVIYSAFDLVFYMAYFMFIAPESITSDALNVLPRIPVFDNFIYSSIENPVLQAVFGDLIYCFTLFIFGIIVSAILSRNIPPRNSFPNNY